ncbi:MAG TPA: hypothetical protein VFP39_13870 [Gemmatimonadales bacterium]|nr:hypothetical protein [Gemmatimonadales bacterium]
MTSMMPLLQTPAPTPPVIVQVPQPPPSIPIDPNHLVNQIIPLVALVVGVIGFVVLARWFFHSPIGEAIAEGIRLRRRRRYGLSGDGADEPRVAALEEQVRLLTAQVGELGERLDFTERMLATQRERRVGAGS